MFANTIARRFRYRTDGYRLKDERTPDALAEETSANVPPAQWDGGREFAFRK